MSWWSSTLAKCCCSLWQLDVLKFALCALHACSQAVEYAAEHFLAVVQQDAPGFCALSTACLADILCSQLLVRCPRRCCPSASPCPSLQSCAGKELKGFFCRLQQQRTDASPCLSLASAPPLCLSGLPREAGFRRSHGVGRVRR